MIGSSQQLLLAGGHTLDDLATDFQTLSEQYISADPFPHIVLDQLFDPDLLRSVESEFSRSNAMVTQFGDRTQNLKSAENRWTHLGADTKFLVGELHSSPFVLALESLTQIHGLIPDPHLVGGGQHQVSPGGHLSVHADFNLHSDMKLYRRLNVILYVNSGWQDDWGGCLELWDRDMRAPVVRISPKSNRMVIFSTTSTSFHGHPDPLRCPVGRFRRSIALYYYSIQPPLGGRIRPHSTLFRARPDESLPLRRINMISTVKSAVDGLRRRF